MGIVDRALVALVRRRLAGRRGVLVWVADDGAVRLLGAGGRAELEGLAWGLDVAYRLGARGLVGERVRLSKVRRHAHTWADGARSRPLSGGGGSGQARGEGQGPGRIATTTTRWKA